MFLQKILTWVWHCRFFAPDRVRVDFVFTGMAQKLSVSLPQKVSNLSFASPTRDSNSVELQHAALDLS